MTEMLVQAVKICAVTATGVSGLLIATDTQGQNAEGAVATWIQTVRELGSFGIVALGVLGLMWVLYKALPKVIEMLERVATGFLNELKEERQAREKAMDDFRAMLASHKNDMGEKLVEIKEAITEGNLITEKYFEEVTSRPCQIVKPPRP